MNQKPPRSKDGRFKAYKAPKPPAVLPETPSQPSESILRAETLDISYTYHKQFNDFSDAVIESTQSLFQARPSTQSLENKDTLFKTWMLEVSNSYNMENPKLAWSNEADLAGGGFYIREKHMIVMSPNRASLITFLHEYRHALQNKTDESLVSEDTEIDARAWSLSLYYQVKPALLKKLVLEGKVFHINPKAFS